MPEIPSTLLPDSTVSLLRKPYDFIPEKCRRFGTDLFRTRIMTEETICMTGPEAAELFYDEDRFVRHGAPPMRIQKTLFGEGGVQGMDGEAHRHRKQLFQRLTTPERALSLAERFAELWHATTHRWAASDRVVLYDEVRELLVRSVLPWAGIPVDEDEVPMRTGQLASLFEQAGGIGPKHWKARFDRWTGDSWAASLVEATREGHLEPPEGSPLETIAHHRDLDGELMEPRIAGVELLNILRPTVAVGVYITDVAHALHENPDWAEGLDDERASRWFVQEVRRSYPFFPAIAARVRRAFTWKGYEFPAGMRVMLDIDGTNHDPRTWEAPAAFRPERFRDREEPPYGFIPQGGGDPDEGHRCPGEPLTLALMETALSCLQDTGYEVPMDQDLAVDRGSLPALPESGFVISDVQPRSPPEADIMPPEMRRTPA